MFAYCVFFVNKQRKHCCDVDFDVVCFYYYHFFGEIKKYIYIPVGYKNLGNARSVSDS